MVAREGEGNTTRQLPPPSGLARSTCQLENRERERERERAGLAGAAVRAAARGEGLLLCELCQVVLQLLDFSQVDFLRLRELVLWGRRGVRQWCHRNGSGVSSGCTMRAEGRLCDEGGGASSGA